MNLIKLVEDINERVYDELVHGKGIKVYRNNTLCTSQMLYTIYRGDALKENGGCIVDGDDNLMWTIFFENTNPIK